MRRFIGHLPLVRLPPDLNELELDSGVLRRIGFDEWRTFDDAFPFADSKYRRTDPVFLELPVDGAGGDARAAFEAGTDSGSIALSSLYRSLLLCSGARVPQPELSIAYLVADGDDLPPEAQGAVHSLAIRRVGRCGRELVVFGDQHPVLPLDRDDLSDVRAAMSLLSARGGAIAGLMSAIVRTTRPAFGTLNETLHLVAGLETLLVSRNEPLTATFARRYSVLGAIDDAREHEGLGRALYALRSDLVHGREVDDAAGEQRAEFLEHTNRFLTCRMALRALRYLARRPGETIVDLQTALDAAFDNPVAYAELRSLMGELV